jgi:hypothetical protein
MLIAPCLSTIWPRVEQFLQPISMGSWGIGTIASSPARKLSAANVVSMSSDLRSKVPVTTSSCVSAGISTLNFCRFRILAKSECRRKTWSSVVWPKEMSNLSKASCHEASATESSIASPSWANETSCTLRFLVFISNHATRIRYLYTDRSLSTLQLSCDVMTRPPFLS